MSDLEQPELDEDDRHHLERVLRLRPGELVTVSDGRGAWRPCVFAARLEPAGPIVRSERPHPQVGVGVALVKGDRPEWAVQKLTEVGVDEILLFTAARSVVRWDDQRTSRHLKRLVRVGREAAMQSRRVWLPSVEAGMRFDEVARRSEAAMAIRGGRPPDLARTLLLVGPEGGWSDQERATGLPEVGLGPAVLRTETAAVVAGVLFVALRSRLVHPKLS